MLSLSLKRILSAVAMLLLIGIGGRFFLRDVPHYFVFTENPILHISGGGMLDFSRMFFLE